MGKWKSLCVALIGLCAALVMAAATGATVEILRTTNISSKVAKIDGLPKSVLIGGVSDDGSVVVGRFRTNKAPYDWQIFRYTLSDGIEILGVSGKSVINLSLSGDGRVIWGSFHAENGEIHVFRYTQTDRFQDLGTFGQKSLQPYATSADGSVIVGSFRRSLTPDNRTLYHAFIYSQSGGFEDLGTMGAESAFARGISADGFWVVGNFHASTGRDHAFRYSRSSAVVDIGAIGGTAAFATSISNDGSVIVGTFYGEFSFMRQTYYGHVFIYTAAQGVQRLGAMGGQSAGTPRISADGTTLVGSYVNADGESHVYTATINPA